MRNVIVNPKSFFFFS